MVEGNVITVERAQLEIVSARNIGSTAFLRMLPEDIPVYAGAWKRICEQDTWKKLREFNCANGKHETQSSYSVALSGGPENKYVVLSLCRHCHCFFSPE